MSDICTVTLTGNLTKDCEIRTAQSGMYVFSFAVACNKYNYKSQADEPHYFDCVMFGKSDKPAQFLKKGTPVTISGSLDQQRWEDQNNQKRSRVQIIVQNIKPHPRKQDTGNQPPVDQYEHNTPPGNPTDNTVQQPSDDIPF